MYKGKKFLAIIPARSGSKGLPDKNIRDLNGKPMIAYTIEAAAKSKIFDHIFVSTDSDRYAKIAKDWGAWVPFLRPSTLATDTSNSLDVVVHTIMELEKKGYVYDYVMLLQPTSPLRDDNDIRKATKLLFDKNAKTIVSVCEVEHSPHLMNTLNSSLSIENFIAQQHNKRRQDLAPYYRINGALYLSETRHFLQTKNFYAKDSYAYIMSQRSSIDVDSLIDFHFASTILTFGQ